MTTFQKEHLKTGFVVITALVVPSAIIIALLYFNCHNEQIFWKGVAKTIFGNILLVFACGGLYCFRPRAKE